MHNKKKYMDKSLKPHHTFWPAMIVIGAVLVGVFVIALWLWPTFGDYIPVAIRQKNTNTNAVTNTNQVANNNTNGASNTNTTNTNTSVAEVRYDVPVGPFTTTDSKTLAAAYRRTTDRLITRLAKVNVTTGKLVTTASMNAVDVQKTLGFIEPPTIASFDFGREGDTFVMKIDGKISGSPTTGLYRASLSDPTKIETIIQYDTTHLYNNDIPTISSYRYNAEANLVVFVIGGDQGVKNNDLNVIALGTTERAPQILKSYSMTPTIVGFPNNGQKIQVLYLDKNENNYSHSTRKWYYDQIDTQTGAVSLTKLVVDESKFTPANQLHLSGDNISPNNTLVAFTRYADGGNKLVFRNLNTGEISEKTISDFWVSRYLWSPDSGKMIIHKSDKITIYDLEKGEVGTVSKVSSELMWYPGSYIMYSGNDNSLYSYNVTTKKSVAISDVKAYRDCGEMGCPNASSSMGWVHQ